MMCEIEAMSANIGISTGVVNGFLTGRDEQPWRSFYRPMLDDILSRIETRLKAMKLSASAASKAAGLSEDAIRNIQRAAEKGDRKGVTTRTLAGLAKALNTTEAWLLRGDGPEESVGAANAARIIGRVGADTSGSVIMSTADDRWDMVTLPPGATTRSVALEVSGHSMNTFAPDGSLIFFEDQQTPPSADLLNEMCVVETEDGQVLVKLLKRGSAAGLYDLESEVGPRIHDVRLRWAAEVQVVVRPRHAQRLTIRGAVQAA